MSEHDAKHMVLDTAKLCLVKICIQMHKRETHLNRNCSFSPCVGYPSHAYCWLVLNIKYEIDFFSVSFACMLCNRTFTNGNNSQTWPSAWIENGFSGRKNVLRFSRNSVRTAASWRSSIPRKFQIIIFAVLI